MAAFSYRLRILLKSAIDGLFPLECVSCGRMGSHCCPSCALTIRPFDAAPRAVEGLDGLCLGYPYANPLLRKLIGDWKYGGITAAEEPLVGLAGRWAQKHPNSLGRHFRIAAVPLHPEKLRHRGFNQADVLAAALAAAVGSAMVPFGALRRLKRTMAQADIPDPGDREANVSGAFSADPRSFRGAAVLLIDDVCTTGATLCAAATALRAAGAARVHGFALAGALHPREKPLE